MRAGGGVVAAAEAARGLVWVTWDSSAQTYCYRAGHEGKHEVQPEQPGAK